MNTDHLTFINFLGYSFEQNGNEKLTIMMEKFANKSLQKIFEDVQSCIAPYEYNNTLRQIILIGIARGMMYLLDCNKISFICPRKILLDENFYPRINICDNIFEIDFRMNNHFGPAVNDIIYLSLL